MQQNLFSHIESHLKKFNENVAIFTEVKKQEKNIFHRLFNIQSEEEKIVEAMLATIKKNQSSQMYGKLNKGSEIRLLETMSQHFNCLIACATEKSEKLNAVGSALSRLVCQMGHDIKTFIRGYSATRLKDNDVNVMFSSEFANQFSIGMTKTRNELLNQAVIKILNNHINVKPKSKINHLIQLTIENLINEEQGISRFARDNQERWECQLNFINEFRLILKDKNENGLYLEISRLLDKSLLTVRSDQSRVMDLRSHIDLKKLERTEIKIKSNDSIYPKLSSINGFFSKNRTMRVKSCSKPVNDRALKEKRMPLF